MNRAPNPRFHLRGLFLFTTLIALCLAIPGGAVLLGIVGGWLLIALLVLCGLLAAQAPIWWAVMKRVSAASSSDSSATSQDLP